MEDEVIIEPACEEFVIVGVDVVVGSSVPWVASESAIGEVGVVVGVVVAGAAGIHVIMGCGEHCPGHVSVEFAQASVRVDPLVVLAAVVDYVSFVGNEFYVHALGVVSHP